MTTTQKMTLTITEAAKALGIGRALAYRLASSGELPTLRLGRRLVVPRAAIDKLMQVPANEISEPRADDD